MTSATVFVNATHKDQGKVTLSYYFNGKLLQSYMSFSNDVKTQVQPQLTLLMALIALEPVDFVWNAPEIVLVETFGMGRRCDRGNFGR